MNEKYACLVMKMCTYSFASESIHEVKISAEFFKNLSLASPRLFIPPP